MPTFRTVLFDLDGTLVDSSADLTAAVNRTLADDGKPPLAVAEVLTMVGDGAAVLLERAYKRRGSEPPEDALERFRGHYEDYSVVHTRPYPGIVELLGRLADRDVAVVTNKPTDLADRVVDRLGLRPFVRAVVGPELVPRRKPEPEHVLWTLEQLGCRAEDAVMVGDGAPDVLAGRRAGLVTVAVTWGFRSREELLACEPDHLVATVDELARLVLDDQNGSPGSY